MAGKGFCVKIRLELHAITCPGVWLCPNGKVALRISSLGSTLESHRVSPIFPLLFHNEFNFKKTFTRLAALTELQRSLEQESLYAELIQWLSPCNQPILLATFETSLADLLYPLAHCKRLLAGVDVDLLMDPTKYFPGIIAPKIEISTKTVIEEVRTIYDARLGGACAVNPKTIDSKRKCSAPRKRPVKGIIRQRKVCHSRGKSKGRVCEPARYQCDSCNLDPCRATTCYHPAKQRSKCPNSVHSDDDDDDDDDDDASVDAPPRNYKFPPVCRNLHMFDSCPVCLKYKCYFSCECDAIIGDGSTANGSSLRDYDCRWCCARDTITTAAHPIDRHYSESKVKTLDAGKCRRLNHISECDHFYTRRTEKPEQGFHKSLELVYRRSLYREAKLRARQQGH